MREGVSQINRRNPEPAAAPADTDAQQLAVWEYAGLMLTYWCNARCAFCYVYSGPDRGGEMTQADALRMWEDLDRLAADHGKTMRIHLAGGEPTGDWPRLAGLIHAARLRGRTPLEKVETNGGWATSEGLTRSRLQLLDMLGMEKLIVSCDVYHDEYVQFDRVERCVRLAREVLGKGRVRVRWWDYFKERKAEWEAGGSKARPMDRAAAFRRALARHKDRMGGRAAEMLAPLLPLQRAEAFAGERCVREVLHSRHVHIDGYGNIFPGVCAGIILGNANAQPVDAVWRELAANWRDHPVVSAVVAGGSYALMQAALPLGYAPRADGYANKCHLCSHVRQFLVDRDLWPEFVGPKACYANGRDRREAATTALTVNGEACGERGGEHGTA